VSWEQMLDRVVRERYPRLLAHATLLTGDRADAQDVLQDALVATFSGRARFATLAEAEAYVRRAVTTRYIDLVRRRDSERRALRVVGSRRTAPVELQPVGVARELVDALAALSPRQRACVVLRHVEDLSLRQTAEALGLSEGAVKRYTADGLAALNALLGTTADDDERVVVRMKEVHDA